MFEQLPMTSSDPLYEVAARYQADTRPERMDLGVGVYRDGKGQSVVMRAVKAAEQRLVDGQSTKAYGALIGNADFLSTMQDLVLGRDFASLRERRIVAVQSCGGTGGLRLAAALARVATQTQSLHLGLPTWPSHAGVFAAEGIPAIEHRYWVPGEQAPLMQDILDAARRARTADIFLFHGPCHNPTGIDLTMAERRDLLSVLHRVGAVPLIDIAYYGLGAGLDTDLDIVRDAFSRSKRAMAVVSCSKSFGLYRERTGILLVQCADSAEAARVRDMAGILNRMFVSSPPAHGAEVVSTILRDPLLSADWRHELAEMRQRIASVRQRLTESGLAALKPLCDQDGIFTMLPLTPAQVRKLARDHAIYLPDNGRANLAGLKDDDVAPFAAALAEVGCN